MVPVGFPRMLMLAISIGAWFSSVIRPLMVTFWAVIPVDSTIRSDIMCNLNLIYCLAVSACVSYYNVKFSLNVYGMRNFVPAVPFKALLACWDRVLVVRVPMCSLPLRVVVSYFYNVKLVKKEIIVLSSHIISQRKLWKTFIYLQ